MQSLELTGHRLELRLFLAMRLKKCQGSAPSVGVVPSYASESSNDIFPLPHVYIPVKGKSDVCRVVRQRIARTIKAHEQCNEIIDALNALCCPSLAPRTSGTPSSAQRCVQDRLLKISVHEGAVLTEPSSEASLCAMLGTKAGPYSVEPSEFGSGPAPFELVSSLSLPRRAGGRPLSSTLEGEDLSDLERFEERLLLTEAELKESRDREGLRRAHFDQKLIDDENLYLETIKTLYERGLLVFLRDTEERVGLFAVRKKNGDQRVRIDCRRLNQLLRSPPHTRLATSGAFAEISLKTDSQVSYCTHDVAECFYQFAIPLSLSRYLALRPVKAAF